jgi:hypothetical protein
VAKVAEAEVTAAEAPAAEKAEAGAGVGVEGVDWEVAAVVWAGAADSGWVAAGSGLATEVVDLATGAAKEALPPAATAEKAVGLGSEEVVQATAAPDLVVSVEHLEAVAMAAPVAMAMAVAVAAAAAAAAAETEAMGLVRLLGKSDQTRP